MFFDSLRRRSTMVTPQTALPGREQAMVAPDQHFVLEHALKQPFPENMQTICFAMGCFWGAERLFWNTPGVWTTAVGYAGGYTKNPTYQEVCTGKTGHTETVLVVFDPEIVTLQQLLQIFWSKHNPTQGMRQGNDTGSQYRSAIYATDQEQMPAIQQSALQYQDLLVRKSYGLITTDIALLDKFYYAESYHQQYLAKNPGGYCGIKGTGVACVLNAA